MMFFLDPNKSCVGKAMKLYDIKFNIKTDCIITYIDKNEVVLMYHDGQINEIIYKTLTKEDLMFSDYKLELLY